MLWSDFCLNWKEVCRQSYRKGNTWEGQSKIKVNIWDKNSQIPKALVYCRLWALLWRFIVCLHFAVKMPKSSITVYDLDSQRTAKTKENADRYLDEILYLSTCSGTIIFTSIKNNSSGS